MWAPSDGSKMAVIYEIHPEIGVARVNHGALSQLEAYRCLGQLPVRRA